MRKRTSIRAIIMLGAWSVTGLACDSGSLFLRRVWSGEDVAVISVLEPTGAVRGVPQAVFSDRALAFDEALPMRLIASVYEPELFGDRVEICELSYESGGFRLPQPKARYASPAIEEVEAEVLFQALGSEEVLPFEVFSSCQPSLPCPQVESIEVFEGNHSSDDDFQDVVILDDQTALVQTSGNPRLWLLRDGRLEPLSQLEAEHGQAEGIAVASGRFYATTDRGLLLTIDPQGQVLSADPITAPEARVSIGSTGYTLLFGEFGVLETQGSTTAVTPVEMLLGPVKDVLVSDSASIVGLNESGIHFFDGIRWNLEREENPLEFQSVKEVTGEDGDYMVIGRRERVLLRAGNEWTTLPPPFNEGRDLWGAAPMGSGRFLVAGVAGGAAMWTGSAWCPQLELDIRGTISEVSVSADRRTAFFSVEGNGATNTVPKLLRVGLSEVP